MMINWIIKFQSIYFSLKIVKHLCNGKYIATITNLENDTRFKPIEVPYKVIQRKDKFEYKANYMEDTVILLVF